MAPEERKCREELIDLFGDGHVGEEHVLLNKLVSVLDLVEFHVNRVLKKQRR